MFSIIYAKIYDEAYLLDKNLNRTHAEQHRT